MDSGNWAPQEAFSFVVPFLTSLVVSWGTHKPASHNTAMADSIRSPPFFFLLPPSCVRRKTNNLSIHVWWSVYTLMRQCLSHVYSRNILLYMNCCLLYHLLVFAPSTVYTLFSHARGRKWACIVDGIFSHTRGRKNEHILLMAYLYCCYYVVSNYFDTCCCCL